MVVILSWIERNMDKDKKMKPWYKSKTVWVNAVIAALSSLELSTGILKPYLPTHWYIIVAVFLPMINVALRVITNQKITITH